MKKHRNITISTFILFCGMLAIAGLAWTYDTFLLTKPSLAFVAGMAGTLLAWINTFFFFWFVVNNTFKQKKDSD